MSLPVKLGAGALALGSAVGVGYGAVNYFSQEDKKDPISVPQTKSVTDLIKEKYEYILLDFSDQEDNPDKEHWTKIWTDYQAKNKTGPDALNLNGWTARSGKDLTNEIKKKCSQLSSSMILNEDEKPYKDVTKYCSRGVTLKDEAEKEGLEAIKTSDNTLDETTWKNKLEKKPNLQKHFENLKLTDSGLNGTKVREKCKELETKVKQNEDYKNILPSYKAVCANPKGV